jgi:hypothetical protein
MSSSKAIIETSKKKKEKNVTCKKNHQKWKMGKSEREWMTYKMKILNNYALSSLRLFESKEKQWILVAQPHYKLKKDLLIHALCFLKW